MQSIGPGDTVTLAAAELLNIANVNPALFEQLKNSGRHGGTVLNVDEAVITIDAGIDAPLQLAWNPEFPERTVAKVAMPGGEANSDEADNVADAAAQDMPRTVPPAAPPGWPDAFSQIMGPFVLQPGRPVSQDQVPIRVGAALSVVNTIFQLKNTSIAAASRPAGMPPVDGEEWKRKLDDETVGTPGLVPMTNAETEFYEVSLDVVKRWFQEPKTTTPAEK